MSWARIARTYFYHPKIAGLDGRIIAADLLAILEESHAKGNGRMTIASIRALSAMVNLPTNVITEALVAAGRWEVDKDGTVVIHDFNAWQARGARIVEFVRVPTRWYQRRLPLDVATWALAIACLRQTMSKDDPSIKIDTVLIQHTDLLKCQKKAAILTLAKEGIWGWNQSDPLYLEVPEPIAEPSYRCHEETLEGLKKEVARGLERVRVNRRRQQLRDTQSPAASTHPGRYSVVAEALQGRDAVGTPSGQGQDTIGTGEGGTIPRLSRACPAPVPRLSRACPAPVPRLQRACPDGVPPLSRACPDDVPPLSRTSHDPVTPLQGISAGQSEDECEHPEASLAPARARASASARARAFLYKDEEERREEEEKRDLSLIARVASDELIIDVIKKRERARAGSRSRASAGARDREDAEASSSESCFSTCVDDDCPLVIWLATRRQMTASSPSGEKTGDVDDASVMSPTPSMSPRTASDRGTHSSLLPGLSCRDRVGENERDRGSEALNQDPREFVNDVTRDSTRTPPRVPPDLAGHRPLGVPARGDTPAKLGFRAGEQPAEAPGGRALGAGEAVGGIPADAGSGALMALEGAEPLAPVSYTTPPPPTPSRATQAALTAIGGAEVCPPEAAAAPEPTQIGPNGSDDTSGDSDSQDDMYDPSCASLGLSAERVKFIQDVISGAIEVESAGACEVYSGESIAALLASEEGGAENVTPKGAGASKSVSRGRGRRGALASSKDETDAADAAFDQFWSTYPRKVAKTRARGVFRRRFVEGLFDEIMVATRNYALARKGESDRFTLHASTFLGPDERWKEWLPGSQQLVEWRQDPKNAGISMQRPIDDALAERNRRLAEYVRKLASAPFIPLDVLRAEVSELAGRAAAIETKRIRKELASRSRREHEPLPGREFMVPPPGARFAAPEEWLTTVMLRLARQGRYVVRFSADEIETVRVVEMAAVEEIEAKRREAGLRALTDPSVLDEFSAHVYRMCEMMCPLCRPGELQQMVQRGIDPQRAGLFIGEDFPRRYDRFVRELVPERIISSVLPEAQRAILAGVERWRADYRKVRDARLAGKVWVSARRGVERAVPAL